MSFKIILFIFLVILIVLTSAVSIRDIIDSYRMKMWDILFVSSFILVSEFLIGIVVYSILF